MSCSRGGASNDPLGGRDARLWWLAAARELGRRPDLWRTAVLVARAHVPRSWWRTKPWLPVPAKRWTGFRMETAYGDTEARPPAEDVVAFLEWCRAGCRRGFVPARYRRRIMRVAGRPLRRRERQRG